MNGSLALENPSPDLTGAQGVNLVPDFIARLRWDPEAARDSLLRLTRTSHVQAALLARSLRGTPFDRPDMTLSTGAFGANVSGVLLPKWDRDDRVKFAGNAGWGIGRYITDLGTLGGQDAVYDATTNQLRALLVSSGYVGYERQWRPTFTSAITYGIVNVDESRRAAGRCPAPHAAVVDQSDLDAHSAARSRAGISRRHTRQQGRQTRNVVSDPGRVDVSILSRAPGASSTTAGPRVTAEFMFRAA